MIAALQKCVDWVQDALIKLVQLLPTSPFTFEVDGRFAEVMGYINYFIPINRFVQIMELWLVAVLVWYVFSAALRWVKAIQ